MVSCLSLNKRSDRHLDTYSHFNSNLLKLGAQCHLNGKTGKYDLPNILNLCTYRYENRRKKKSTSQNNFPNCYISKKAEDLQHKTKCLSLQD